MAKFKMLAETSDVKIVLNGRETDCIIVAEGGTVDWEVSAEGYVTQSGTDVVYEDTTKEIYLLLQDITIKVVPNVEGAKVVINGLETDEYTGKYGEKVTWEVSAEGFETATGEEVLLEDKEIAVLLRSNPFIFVYNNNTISIKLGSSMSGAYAFGIGEPGYDIEINGVLIEDVAEDRTYGSEYLNDTGNVIKIFAIGSAMLYGRNAGAVANNQAAAYISEVQSWGGITYSQVEYMFSTSSSSTHGALVSFPKLSKGFSGVTSFSYMFAYCKIEELPDGIFENCTEARSFNYMFAYNTELKKLNSRMWAGLQNVTDLTYMFRDCSALESVPADLFGGISETLTTISGVFMNTGLTEIPEGLLDECVNVTAAGYVFRGCGITRVSENLFAKCTKITNFQQIFCECSELTTVPAGLFANNPEVTNFQSAFYEAGLTSVPEDLFANNTKVTTFYEAFNYCKFESVPEGLFRNNVNVTNMAMVFGSCANLQGVPEGLFANNTKVTNISQVFYACSALTVGGVPEGLFKNLTEATYAERVFYGCNNLTTIPVGLFANNTKITSFSYLFRTAGIISLPENVFANNKVVTDFGNMFYGCTNYEGESPYDLVEIDGVETKIHLYERANYPDIYTAPKSYSNCFYNCTKMTDYDQIPSAWGGGGE